MWSIIMVFEKRMYSYYLEFYLMNKQNKRVPFCYFNSNIYLFNIVNIYIYIFALMALKETTHHFKVKQRAS